MEEWGHGKMIFGTIETDKVPEAAEFCDVDPESAKLEIRLILRGGTRCVQHLDSEPLVEFVGGDNEQTDFITESTGKIPKKSYVKFLNIPLFEKMKADTSVSHFIEIMSPFQRECYDFSIQVEKAAESFAVPFSPCIEVDGAERRFRSHRLLADARPLRQSERARHTLDALPPRRGRRVQQHVPSSADGGLDRPLPERAAGHAPHRRWRSRRALRSGPRAERVCVAVRSGSDGRCV